MARDGARATADIEDPLRTIGCQFAEKLNRGMSIGGRDGYAAITLGSLNHAA
jgi:hypothetical protein